MKKNIHSVSVFHGLILDSCYCQTSNISDVLVGNKIIDHSDVVGT